MIRQYLLIFLLFLIPFRGMTQSFFIPSDTLDTKRLGWTVGVVGGGLAVSLGVLYSTWYSDYESKQFHFHNDNDNWLGMDKAGHAHTTYTMGRYSYDLLKWSGVSENKSVWYGGMVGFTYLGIVEVMDGYSNGWGFSWGDFTANTMGTGLFIGQQLAWKEQRISLKISYSSSPYAEYNPRLLGSVYTESALKDYNGQTYWLSVSPGAFSKDSWWPEWLAISGGYGADGMIGSFANPAPYQNIQREHQYYLALDLDLSRINTKSEFWNTLLHGLNFIKFPAPAIEYRPETGFVKGHWFMF